MKNVKSLLEYHNLPTDKLEDILKLHFEGKKKMFDVLGLNEKNNWRIEVKLPLVCESKSVVSQFLNEINQVTGKYTVINKNSEYMSDGKNQVRVGKILSYYLKDKYFEMIRLISKYKEEYEKVKLEGCNTVLRDNLCATCELFEIAKITFEDKDIWDDEKIEKIVAKFSCFYGDFIKSQRTGFISGNPLDYFLLSGAGTTFSSCIKIGGDYFNSCLHYLCNPNTIISYTTDDTYTVTNNELKKQLSNMPKEVSDDIHKKIGRSLFYINKGLIIASKYYGSYYEEENKAFIEFLKSKMGGEFKDSSLNSKTVFHNNNTSAYIDFSHTKVFTRDKFDKIEFNSGKCLECGDDIGSYPQKGLCDPCANKRNPCAICGKRVNTIPLTNYDNMLVCDECLVSKFRTCGYCSNYIKPEDAISIINSNNVKRHYCKECIKTRSKKCKVCGTLYTNQCRFTNGICESCLTEEA